MTDSDLPRERADPETPAEWAHVRSVVDEALTLPHESRIAFLDASCGNDDTLRERVHRLVVACDRADGSWGFLAQPAGELAAPLLVDAENPASNSYAVDAELPLRPSLATIADQLARLSAGLDGRYRVERELATGGMATVYLAHDIRHERRVAIKVLHPELSAMLGAERFLAEIRTTAALQHAHILPLFDSGSANGLLFYVMPLVEGETLRARLVYEKQLPVADAVRITREVADALDYAHRRGVVHRDIKPENILLHDGRPLVADFGIALAVHSAGAKRMTRPGLSLGTPPYMSPEQAAGDATVDGRSDIYSLASVLYELLAGDTPFTGRTAQAVIAKVLSDAPASVRTLRPSVPVHVDIALLRALSKQPADRYATARTFADALVDAPITPSAVAPVVGVRGRSVHWRRPGLLAVGAVAIGVIAMAVSIATRTPAAPDWFVLDDLIEQSIRSGVSITADGNSLVYTGSSAAGSPLMVRAIGQLSARVLPGTEGGYLPFVSPSSRRLVWVSGRSTLSTVSIDRAASSVRGDSWKFGSGAWVNDSVIVTEVGSAGLRKGVPGGTLAVLTQPDTARGKGKHAAPLVLPGARAVVFTVRSTGVPGLVTGPLAMASLDPVADSLPTHVLLGVTARQAVAFVDGWLLYTSEDGKAIMAAQLDVRKRRILGSPISVLDDSVGNLESAALANNGTLLYVRRPRANSIVFVDSLGAAREGFASVAGTFMYPRLSPDGQRFAVQVTTAGRHDVWVYDIKSRTPRRLTTTGSALHPAWTPDGRNLIFIADGRTLMSQPVDGGGAAVKVAGTDNPFAPLVTSDGSVVFQRRSAAGWDVWIASPTGRFATRKVMDGQFSSSMPAVSADGRWLAYVSMETGRDEVWARPLTGPGQPVQVSDSGGIEPAWSRARHRIYYLHRGALMEVTVDSATLDIRGPRRQLFKIAFDDHLMPHRNYDVAPSGGGFLMIAPPKRPEAVVGRNWLPELRARLARAR